MKVSREIVNSIVDDTGWSVKDSGVTSVTDYERVIKFNRELTSEEMNEVVGWVRLEKFPGWFATPQVTATREGSKTGAWKFEATVDSSG